AIDGCTRLSRRSCERRASRTDAEGSSRSLLQLRGPERLQLENETAPTRRKRSQSRAISGRVDDCWMDDRRPAPGGSWLKAIRYRHRHEPRRPKLYGVPGVAPLLL